MRPARGYVVVLSSARKTLFDERRAEERTFGEPVPEFARAGSAPLVCFVTSAGKLIHLALGRRGMRSGTDLRRLNLEDAEPVVPPIQVQRILRAVPGRTRASIKRRMANGGLLTQVGFEAVMEAVRQLAPDSASILNRFSRERYERIARLTPRTLQALAYQKEAVLTALSLADIDRDPVQEWTPTESPAPSFLDGLPNARLREDPMVVHDLRLLPGFEVVRHLPYSAAVFESGRERVTIVLANRLPLEEQTGSDLIYFNETYQSFVMVQYKAMDRDSEGEAGFRLPDQQLAEEIARMDRLLGQLRGCEPSTSHDGFRLTDNPFFLKMCPRLVFDPDNVSLIPGMYLPLEYWRLVEKRPEIVGLRGGRRVTYGNVGRYFDNSGFVSVVAKAWVGTTPNQSAILAVAIRETLKTGRAVAIAVRPRLT